MTSPIAVRGDAVPIAGAYLRRIRIERGIGISTLAQRVGISRSYLTNLELGRKQRASLSVHTALRAALGLTDPYALRPDGPTRPDA